MYARSGILILLAAFLAVPALSQVQPDATGGGNATPEDDAQMMTPPPVSGIPYPNVGQADVRSNYLDVGINAEVGYIDNVLPGTSVSQGTTNAGPVSDTEFSVFPSVALQRTTTRQTATVRYSPSFLFYEPTSTLNGIDHAASGILQERLSPHLSITLEDFFLRTSNIFNNSYPFSSGGLSGSTQVPVPAIIAPFAEQMNNNADVSVSYQFSRNAMIGGGGSYSSFDLPNPSQALGLDTSTGEGASAFYSRRLASQEYIGLAYDYSRTVGGIPYVPFNAQTHSLQPFFTVYFGHAFSASLTGGIQRTTLTQAAVGAQAPPTSFTSWSPSVVASLGWQGKHGNLAASYLHAVISGQGLFGAFTSDSGNASGGLRLSRTWNGRMTFSYTTTSSVASLAGLSYNGGDNLTAEAALSHDFGEHLSATFGYDRLHEVYSGVEVISANPDSDRGFFNVSYQFRRPLGR